MLFNVRNIIPGFSHCCSTLLGMRGAVLIIGSLLWDTDTKRIREKWRNERLDLSKAEPVTAPIRYARRSISRGNTFTMTFGPDGTQGRAIVAPCRNEIDGIEDLVAEARALWSAERLSQDAGPIGADWGCVAAAFQCSELPLHARWSKFFGETAKSSWPIAKDGRLPIPWPCLVSDGKPCGADVLLATATSAAGEIPTPDQVADAWVTQDGGHEAYFFNNVKHCIRTPDDLRIWRRIKARSPDWLKPSSYADATAVLERELKQTP